MENKETILILNFYGQYNQLIARRVRECNVYSEIVPHDISWHTSTWYLLWYAIN